MRSLAVALLIALGVGSIGMLLARVSPLDGFGALLDGAFGTRSEIAETVVQATALLFPALGIALAFRAGLFNIGAEGQLVLGGLAAGVVAALLAGYVVDGPLRLPGANAGETPLLPAAAWLPALVPGTRLTIAALLGLLAAAGLALALHRTVFGYELRAAGEAPEAARRAGIDVPRIALLALALAGGLAGLGGATIVTGMLHRFNTGMSGGYGFIAIAVALVGNLDAGGIVLASLGFGILQNGALSMQAEANVPRDVVSAVEGLVIVALAGRRYIAARRST